MTSRKRSHSDLQKGSDFIDDIRYRKVVLQLDAEQDAEELLEGKLLDEARQLGLLAWDTDSQYSRIFGSTSTRTPPATPSSASVMPPSTANTSTVHISESSYSTFASSKYPVPSSRHSIVSSSTCPTSCSCNERRFSSLSLAEKLRNNRLSLDPSRLPSSSSTPTENSNTSRRRESRDGRLRFGLKHALLRFPAFKKRTSYGDSTSVPPSTCSACPSLPTASDTGSQESHPTDARLPEWTHPVKRFSGSTDEASISRSQASPRLSRMRSSQQDQKNRHLVFQREVTEEMAIAHKNMLESQRCQNQKTEKDLADHNSEKAARAEERQLSAELSLLEDFKREKLALKSCIHHMEAYFNTPAPIPTDFSESSEDSSLSRRQYTKQQRDRLLQKQRERDSIDTLHESKIKVLRDRQDKQSDESMRKMEREANELAEKNEHLYLDLERRCHAEESATLAWLEARQKRLTTRWILEEAILRKKLEIEADQVYGPLPALSFEELQI